MGFRPLSADDSTNDEPLRETTASAEGFPLQLEFVSWYHKPRDAFVRIAEYLDPEGGEFSPGRTIVRTDPETREGYYQVFSFSEKLEVAPLAVRVEFSYLLPDGGGEPVTKAFPLPENREGRELWIGLTGRQKPPPGLPVLAWRLRLLDDEAQLLLEADSYLWDAH
ncbi:MAG: hypothetical protein ACFB21_13345 [Opitutales bacterium]